jgi:hypothetical protein
VKNSGEQDCRHVNAFRHAGFVGYLPEMLMRWKCSVPAGDG